MKHSLLRWQNECLEQWRANQYRGIVNVVTGAGKTVLALGAIEMLSSIHSHNDLKVKIIVPKTFLMYQWHSALSEDLGIPYYDIGFFSGAHKTAASCKFMIYVINSARSCITRHIVDDIATGNTVFLIADECHHYGSEENSKIFDFIKYIPTDSLFYTLGLSATPISKNYDEVLVPALGKEIFRLTFLNALNDGIISRFIIFNICVSFDKTEAAEYEELSEKLSIALYQLKQEFPSLHSKNGYEFFASLESIDSDLAKAVMFLAIKRKEIVYLAKSRTSCVINLVRLTPKSKKIIIFGERIETAEVIYERLVTMYPNEVGIYHSKIQKTIGKNTLRQFENFEIRILVSCKTLDEGLNISETDVGIVVSSTGSKRQRVQRLGRVLRKKRSSHMAHFYYLFVDNTSEEDELLKEMSDRQINGIINVIDIIYDEEAGAFSNPYYMKLLECVEGAISERGFDSKKAAEFSRNAELGLLTGDWLMSEAECQERIETADSKAEKNYYIAMLLIIRARLHKELSEN